MVASSYCDGAHRQLDGFAGECLQKLRQSFCAAGNSADAENVVTAAAEEEKEAEEGRKEHIK